MKTLKLAGIFAGLVKLNLNEPFDDLVQMYLNGGEYLKERMKESPLIQNAYDLTQEIAHQMSR